MFYQRSLLGMSANQKRHYLKTYNNTLYFLWLYNEFFIILYNILKISELDCCQIIIFSIYVPSTHAYTHILRLSLDLICLTRQGNTTIIEAPFLGSGFSRGVVLNYETKSKRNERNETKWNETKRKYYETQRNILKCETKRNEAKYTKIQNETQRNEIY